MNKKTSHYIFHEINTSSYCPKVIKKASKQTNTDMIC